MLPRVRQTGFRTGAAFRLILVLVSLGTALLPAVIPRKDSETFSELSVQPAAQMVPPRSLSTVVYAYPSGAERIVRTYSRTELLSGSLMLLDDAHSLPADAPAPNTMSAALYGKGMVPVRSLQVKSGLKTLEALIDLFRDLHARGVNGLAVWDGTVSPAEQRARLIAHAHSLLQSQTVESAVRNTYAVLDAPGTGELLQEYGVELRFRAGTADTPLDIPLESTREGQLLLQTAWRYGFIRPQPDAGGRESFRFRWVGKAHAAAMTYLELSLKDYLSWLHEKGVLTIMEAGTPKYVIVCEPFAGSRTAFSLPEGAVYEASLDNMGYAVVAATLP